MADYPIIYSMGTVQSIIKNIFHLLFLGIQKHLCGGGDFLNLLKHEKKV